MIHPLVKWSPTPQKRVHYNVTGVQTDHGGCLGEWNVVDDGDLLILPAVAALGPTPKFAGIVGKTPL
jgi:hypothetical protein